MIIQFRNTSSVSYVGLDLNVEADRIRIRASFAPRGGEEECAAWGEEAETGPERAFTLADLRRRPWWKDCNVVGLSLTGAALPVRAECVEARQYELSHVAATRPDVAVLLYVPDTEALFTDMAIMPLLGPDTDLICNVPVAGTLAPGERAGAKMAEVMPRLILTGPNAVRAGDKACCDVSALLNGQPYPWLLDIYLESVNGLLPKNRLRVGGEPVSFPVLTTGLEPGDFVKVKAGFRFLPSRTEHVIRIIASEEGGDL